jgi:phosphoribosylformylglycinamidine synthase subunit PurQ / glutaminase
MKFGVVTFPGSNCEDDAVHVLANVLKQKTVRLWHKDSDLQNCDVIVLPGGFSYGDYLRCGAIARFSKVMESVVAHANRGGTVIGICNGFQVLTEAQLLPGALLRNASLKYACQPVQLSVVNARTRFTNKYRPGQTIEFPIAHGEGNYLVTDAEYQQLEDNGQIVFRYLSNPNGSKADIAGVCNVQKNVLGLMPHPERAAEPILGSADGLSLFESLLS